MDWECAILKTYESLGGRAYNKQVYGRVTAFYPLNAFHLRVNSRWGDRAMYTHTVRKFISMLPDPKRGELRRITNGLHELTAKGRQRVTRC